MEGVTLPTPPEGFEYRLMKKPSVRHKDPSGGVGKVTPSIYIYYDFFFKVGTQ